MIIPGLPIKLPCFKCKVKMPTDYMTLEDVGYAVPDYLCGKCKANYKPLVIDARGMIVGEFVAEMVEASR